MDLADFLFEEERLPVPHRLHRLRGHRGHADGRVLLAPAPFEDERVQGAVDFVFGHRVLKSDIELAFSAFVDGHFYRAKIGRPYKGVEGSIERGEHALTIGGSILRDNLQVGTFRRSFVRKKTGEIIARHDLLKLDDELPLGIGSTMLRNTLQFEIRTGVREVYLSAAWVGRYVWASLGWTWADADERSDKLLGLRLFLKKILPPGTACFSTDTRSKACISYSSPDEGATGIVKILARAPAFEIASLRLYEPYSGEQILSPCPAQRDEGARRRIEACHAGKVFLLSPATSDWEGVLRLREGDLGFEHCKQRLRLDT